MKKIFLLFIFFLLISFTLCTDFQKKVVELNQVNFYEYNNVVFTPDGTYCFIPDTFNDRVIRINLINYSVESIDVDDGPIGVYISPDGSIVTVVCAGTVGLAGDKVDLIKARDDSLNVFQKVEGDFNFSYYNNVVFSPDGIYGFVASNNTGYVYCFDAYSGEIISSIYLGLNVNYLDITPDGSKLAVSYNVNGFANIGIVDISIDDSGVSMDVNSIISTGTVFNEKNVFKFIKSGKYISFPLSSNNKIAIYEVDDGNLYKEISTSGSPIRIFTGEYGDVGFSIIPSTNSILFMDFNDFSYFEKSYSSYFSEDSWLVYAPLLNRLFVNATGSNKLLELDSEDGDEIDSWDLPSNPTFATCNFYENKMGFLSIGDNDLTLLYKNYEYVLSDIKSDDGHDTGFSFINGISGIASNVFLTPYDSNGVEAGNFSFSINYFSQYVRSWTSFNEGGNLPYPFEGWLKVMSDKVFLKGFSMLYRKDEEEMDGYVFKRPSKKLIIPSIVKENISSTKILIVNCNPSNVHLKLKLYKSNGYPSNQKYENLNPWVKFKLEDILTYFDVSLDDIENGAYLTIESDKPVVALMKVSSGDGKMYLVNFISQDEVLSKGIFPHYAVGSGWDSNILVSNLSSVGETIHLRFYSESGTLLKDTSIFLGGYSSFYKSVNYFLNLEDDTTLTTGWIEIRGDQKTVGNLFFNYNDSLFTQLPLQYRGSTDFFISQIAQNDYYFTGIALVNDSFEDASIDIAFYTEDGALILSYNLNELPNKNKFVRLLSVDPFDILDQIGGFIQIKSDRPIFSYAVFGNLDKFISAIPSQN